MYTSYNFNYKLLCGNVFWCIVRFLSDLLFLLIEFALLLANSFQIVIHLINPLNPHDALKHHFTSLRTDLIFLQLRVLERKFPSSWFTNTWQFSVIFKPHQIIFIHYKLRIATAICGL